MRSVSLALAVSFCLLSAPPTDAQQQRRVAFSAEVSSGLMSYYYSDDHHPLASVEVGATVLDYARLYVEGTRVWARQSLTCLGSCEGQQRTVADPLWYANVGLQLTLPLGSVRPYVGGDLGRLFTCGPEGWAQAGDEFFTWGGECSTRSLEAGTRIRASPRIDGRLGIRRRYDDRFGNTMPKMLSTEFRVGLGYTLH